MELYIRKFSYKKEHFYYYTYFFKINLQFFTLQTIVSKPPDPCEMNRIHKS